MQTRQRITPLGLSALLYNFLLGSSLVLPIGARARQDAWLAVLLGGVAGIGLSLVYATLAHRFPGRGMVGYSQLLLGRWVGGLVGLMYVWYSLHLGALVLRNFSEFVVSTLLPGTPIVVPTLILGALGAHAARHGPETVARASQALTAVVTMNVLLATVLVANQVHLEYLRPVLEGGLASILPAAFATMSFPFGETVILAQVFSLVHPVPGARSRVVVAVMLSAGLLTLVQARNMAVLGPELVASARFPSLEVMKAIDVAEFLTRVDALVSVNWIATGFVKIALCLYAASIGIAEGLNLQDYRPMVFPVLSAATALSIAVFPNATAMARFAVVIWPVYSIPFQLVMPLLLLVLALAFRRDSHRTQSGGGEETCPSRRG